jgi:GNAT superfamily N-acetyltransferase
MTPATAPVIVRATPNRWPDVHQLLDGTDEIGCWCQAWRGFDTKRLSGGRSRRELLRGQMDEGPPAPGYLAYLDGEPVGWVGVSVRTDTPRLVSSRTIPAIDDLPVWSIGCFRIRPGYRRRGVAQGLLDGVVAAARQAGAPGVEAYPIDPAGRRRLRRHCLDVRCGRVPPHAHDRCTQRAAPPPPRAPGPLRRPPS